MKVCIIKKASIESMYNKKSFDGIIIIKKASWDESMYGKDDVLCNYGVILNLLCSQYILPYHMLIRAFSFFTIGDQSGLC